MKKLFLLLLLPFMAHAQSPGSEEAKEKAKAQLEGYRERILKGESFTTLARLYSEDPGSAQAGGLIVHVKRGVMVKQFEDVAFSIRQGDVSEVFETEFGMHILQVIEKRNDELDLRHILIIPK